MMLCESRTGTAESQVAEGPVLPSTQSLVVALGSNLDDRVGHFCFALRRLGEEGIHLDTLSSVYETPPIGNLHQPPFLNMVAGGSTHLPPGRVLSIFQQVEGEAGRTAGPRNAPRPLDLDLLFFQGKILRRQGLRVPHPRWKERTFVVLPLMEISPGLRDPETGCQVQEIAGEWPMEPTDIRIVLSPEGFLKECKE